MKLGKLITGFVLSTLLAVGVGVGIGSARNEVKSAKAGASHTIYFATTTSRSNYYARCQYGNNWYGSHTFSLAGRSGTNYIYTASVYEEYGGLDNMWIKYGNNPTGDTGGTLVFQAINGYKAVNTYENKVVTAASTWKDIYTITYNPNGASGSTKTDYKISGVSYTILSYSSAGISSHAYKHSVKWGTNSSGTGTSYQPNATYSTNANLSLYFIEDWYTYQFSVNNGSWITLSKTDDTPEGYVAQFATTSTYSFASGDSLTFRKYYGSETPISITPSAYENNIHDGIIYYSYTGNLYLKLTEGNGHTIFVEGFSDRGIAVQRGSKVYKVPGIKDSESQWHVSGFTVLPGDKLFTVYQGTTYPIVIENTDLYGIDDDGDVTVPGVFTFYQKPGGDYQWRLVYCEMEEASSAKLLAQTFNTDLETVCNSTKSGGDTSQITSAFSTHSGYYSHLTENTQNLLNGKTSTSDKDVLSMQTKYDYIVGKYGKTIAPDYLVRNPASLSSSRIGLISIFGQSNSNSTAILIAIVSTVVTVGAVAGYFFYKKKKED